MAAGGGGATRSLQETPTWALATVCFVFIFLGVFIEHLIHLLCQWLKNHRKNALFEAIERLKSVLMLMGFMSLLLAVIQRPVSKICVPNKVAYSMLPCRKKVQTKTTKHWASDEVNTSHSQHWGRQLAANSSSNPCGSEGMTSLISSDGMNQLSIFIFVLAVMQIVYTVATMALGRAKMRRWKAWEKETQTVEYQAANDPNRFRLTRQTTFGRRHMTFCTTTPIELWIKCFFRQFFNSVAKVDYLTLRHGFIAAHLSGNNTFNFRKYIQRSLEDDFKGVVGISPFMWLLAVIFILVDVHGWEVYLWVSFLPLIIALVLGTKLELIVGRMALQLKDHNIVIKGTPVVQPSNDLFWFGQPQLVLTLIHYILFMNAFELAFFVWVTLQFGFHSCYHERIEIIVIRVVLAVTVQVLCSYITLPLYALVTQMGSNFKSTAVLEEKTVHAIRQWHAEVRDRRRKRLFSSRSRRGGAADDSLSGVSVWSTSSSRRPNSPDFSSHRRSPALAEFAARHTNTNHDTDEIVADDDPGLATHSSVDEMQIEINHPETMISRSTTC